MWFNRTGAFSANPGKRRLSCYGVDGRDFEGKQYPGGD